MEVLWSYDIHRDHRHKTLKLVACSRKCLHYYHYFMHPLFGFMHARLATWFPFTIHLCINGREWLAGQLDSAGVGYQRRENCFTGIADLRRAQELFDAQLKTDWPATLDAVADQVNPARRQVFAKCPVDYYWSAEQSEWASDVMFKRPSALAAVYPDLVRHSMLALGSRDVMRFLGKRVPATGGIDKRFKGEVISDLQQRVEGTRVKHFVKGNALKMYDKQGSVLRIETTLNDPHDLKVYRHKEGDKPDASRKWRPMRKGVADLHARAQTCQAINLRYLNALAAAEHTVPLGELAQKVCRRTRRKRRSFRALNPLSTDDAQLLQAVNRGEFALCGFRNRDIRQILYPAQAKGQRQAKCSAAVTRKLLLLRAHGLIRKIPKSHRYQLSDTGRKTIAALLAARQADTAKLTKAA